MSCDTTVMMTTPQRLPLSDIDNMYLIEDLEKNLESFSHLLEKSTERGKPNFRYTTNFLKEKTHMKRITEQAAAISSLQIEKEDLKEENDKLKLTIEKYMQNFVCFMENISKTVALEEENVNLKKKLEQIQDVRA